MRRTAFVAVALVAAAALFAAAPRGGGQDGPAPALPSSPVRVVRVVDGDTIRVRTGGREERVRYIGIDTPEVSGGVECFGRAATAANRRLVGGERVRLVADVEPRDRYGRLLAYVFRARDGRFVNAELVRGGFALPLTVPPNVRHAERFARLARQARRAGRGLWRACDADGGAPLQ